MNWTSQTIETVLAYPKAIMTLSIPKGATGQQIIDAAHTVIKKNKASDPKINLIEDSYYRDDDVCFIIGQQSMDPDQDLILLVEQDGSFTNLIHPEGGYIRVRVVSHHWEGRKYAVNSRENVLVDACRQFRDDLKKLLDTSTQPGE